MNIGELNKKRPTNLEIVSFKKQFNWAKSSKCNWRTGFADNDALCHSLNMATYSRTATKIRLNPINSLTIEYIKKHVENVA